jgi:hypothetical protein
MQKGREALMRCQWFDLAEVSREDLTGICPPGEYRVVEPELIPTALPKRFLDKCAWATLMVSGAENLVVVCNYARQDPDDPRGLAIDEQPFAFGFSGEQSTGSGVLVHHGDWSGRTTYVPQGIDDYHLASGIGVIANLPNPPAGTLWLLQGTSHEYAFRVSSEPIRRKLLSPSGNGRKTLAFRRRLQ